MFEKHLKRIVSSLAIVGMVLAGFPVFVEPQVAEAYPYGGLSEFATGGSPYGVVVVDLDLDGDTDIATVNYNDGNVSILLNNGDGTYADKTDYATGGSSVYSITSEDIDEDGYEDLITSNSGSDNVSILINDTYGGFQLGDVKVYSVGTTPVFTYVADVDSTNGLDLIVANSGSANVSVL